MAIRLSAEVASDWRFVADSGEKRLIMIFLGWGMSYEPFASMAKPGYDILLLYDYRSGDCGYFADLKRTISRYSEIIVIAWSFGVVAASYTMDALHGFPITRRIAINGTPQHIDRKKGIPPAIFGLTLKNLSPISIGKFTERMFVNDFQLSNYLAVNKSRSFDSQLAELQFFETLPKFEGDATWDFAIVGGRDLIFPPNNQLAYWVGSRTAVSQFPDAGHFFDLQNVIEDYVVDKELVANRFGSTRCSYRDNAEVQRAVALKLWETAKPFVPYSLNSVLEIGVGDGLLTEQYAKEISIEELTLLDIADVDGVQLPKNSRFVRCDAESEIRELNPESIDLIISASTLQWFHSAEQFVANAYKSLKPGGILAISMFCDGTYREVAAITGVSLKYPNPSNWNIDGEILVFEREELVATFETPSDAVRHISRTGVNALRRNNSSSVNSGRRLLRELKLNGEGKITLTFVPYYLVVRKPGGKSNT